MEDTVATEDVFKKAMNTIVKCIKEEDIAELESVLDNMGVCNKCRQIPVHHVDEPFSSCMCGTGEDYAKKPFQALQIIKKQVDDLYTDTSQSDINDVPINVKEVEERLLKIKKLLESLEWLEKQRHLLPRNPK